MCGPAAPFATIAFVGSTALSAYGELQAGRAAGRAASMEAHQYETRRLQIATEASHEMRARYRQFEETMRRNRLAMAMSGFTEASFDALVRGSEETVAEDMLTIQRSGEAQQADMRVASTSARARGRAARRAGALGALGTLVGGAFQYETQRGTDMPSLREIGVRAVQGVQQSLVRFGVG
jgi:hypothetical protein